VEALPHESEKGVGQDQRKEPDYARTHQLYSKKLTLARRQQAFLLMQQAERDHAPQTAE